MSSIPLSLFPFSTLPLLRQPNAQLTKRWLRCFTPNFSPTPLRPLSSLADWNIHLVRNIRLFSLPPGIDNVAFVHMFAWNMLRRTRTWKTKLYFAIFSFQFIFSLIDYEATGYKSLASWIVFVLSMAAQLFTVWSAWETRDMNYARFFALYQATSFLTYLFSHSNLTTVQSDNLQLKLIIRFVVDPMVWETLKATHRHAALMNPSPGCGLNVANFMIPIVNQAIYSRLLLFFMSNDGSIDMFTVQMILSFNELMMYLTLKHRDAVFTRYTLGTTPAETMLATQQSEELHATQLLGSTFSELVAIMFVTPIMTVFNLYSSGVLADGTFRTTDYNSLTLMCIKLCIIEIVLFFLVVFVQYRFHGVDIARVFKRAETEYERNTGGPKNTRLFSYRFWMYLLMGVAAFVVCVARGQEKSNPRKTPPSPHLHAHTSCQFLFLRVSNQKETFC